MSSIPLEELFADDPVARMEAASAPLPSEIWGRVEGEVGTRFLASGPDPEDVRRCFDSLKEMGLFARLELRCADGTEYWRRPTATT